MLADVLGASLEPRHPLNHPPRHLPGRDEDIPARPSRRRGSYTGTSCRQRTRASQSPHSQSRRTYFLEMVNADGFIQRSCKHLGTISRSGADRYALLDVRPLFLRSSVPPPFTVTHPREQSASTGQVPSRRCPRAPQGARVRALPLRAVVRQAASIRFEVHDSVSAGIREEVGGEGAS